MARESISSTYLVARGEDSFTGNAVSPLAWILIDIFAITTEMQNASKAYVEAKFAAADLAVGKRFAIY
jgi:hypothetical protein